MFPLIRSLISSVSASPMRTISTTSVCFAEPLKKRKKVDIEVLKLRQERKIRKVEREIRRMKRVPRQLKPVEEYSLPPRVMKEIEMRTRKVDENEKAQLDRNLHKMAPLWSDYMSIQRQIQKRDMKRVLDSQSRALQALRELDEELYQNAVAKHPAMEAYFDHNIVKETPANPEYRTRDGKKTDASKEWTM